MKMMLMTLTTMLFTFNAFGSGDVVIHPDCYRGWLENTIAWDRPETSFIVSLIEYGYTPERAESIATLVCDNPNLVHDDQAMVEEVTRLISIYPR